jgi:hypothetical protein
MMHRHASRQVTGVHAGGGIMFLGLFIVLFICWLLGFVVFHVASGLIHLLLIVGVISLILHFVRPRTVV